MIKKIFLFFCFAVCKLTFVHAQLVCVQCYDTNDSIGVQLGSSNLILNGGFENSTCGPNGFFCPSAQSYNCNIANWTCTGGGLLTYATLYDSAARQVVEGAKAAYFGNNYANSCSGTETGNFPNNDTLCLHEVGCEIKGVPDGYPMSGPFYGGTSGVSLSQTVNGLIPGNEYVLEFWAGGEYTGWFSKPGMFAVDIGFGKIYLACKITQQLPDTGTRYLIRFLATSTTHTINFINWGHICGTCTEVVIDDVRLYPASFLPGTIQSCLTSNVEIKANRLSLYPNPAQSFLEIKNVKSGLYRMVNAIGEEVWKKYLDEAEQVHLDISFLPKGVYFFMTRDYYEKIVLN